MNKVISKYFSNLSKKHWRKKTKEERREAMKKLSLKRWEKKRVKK